MRKYTPVVLLTVLAGLSALLLTYRLGMFSYWGDEVGSIMYARNDFVPMVRMLLREDVHPPLYYAVLHWWIGLFGEGEAALRFLSVIPAVLALFVVYRLGKELFDSRVALLAVLLLVVSPELLLFGRMVRYYSLAMLFGSCATLTFFRFLRDGRTRHLIAYVVWAALLLYTTYTTLSVIIAHNLIVLWSLRQREPRKRLLPWFAGQAALALLYAPCIVLFFLMIVRMSREALPASDLSAGLAGIAVKCAYALYGFCCGETLFPWRFGVVVPVLAVAAAALWVAFRKRTPAVSSLFLLVAVPVGFTVAILSSVKTSSSFLYTPSRTLFALPYFCMLLSYGLCALDRPRLRAVMAAVLIFGAGVSVRNYFLARDVIMPAYVAPWNEVLRDIQRRADPQDVVVAEETREFLYYYGREKYRFRFFADEDEAREYLIQRPFVKIFYVRTGRDHQPSGLSPSFCGWITSQYRMVNRTGYVPVDAVYARLKERILKREPYRFKIEVFEYRRKDGETQIALLGRKTL